MKLENEFLLVEIAAQGAELTKKMRQMYCGKEIRSSGVAILHCFSRM